MIVIYQTYIFVSDLASPFTDEVTYSGLTLENGYSHLFTTTGFTSEQLLYKITSNRLTSYNY